MNPFALRAPFWPLRKEDDRRSSRVSHVAALRYRLLDREGYAWHEAGSVNLSQGGVQMLSASRLQIGETLDLDIPIAGEDQPFKVKGKVSWMRQSDGLIRYGVSFLSKGSRDHTRYLADQLCQLAGEDWKQDEARPAQTFEELKEAYHLVYQEFLKRGYSKEKQSKMYYHLYSLLPETRTFLLHEKGTLLGTVTLVPQSALGLPMERVFPDEVKKLKEEGRKLAEVTLLSVDQSAFGKNRFLLTNLKKLASAFRLFKILFDSARYHGITDLIIGMHPKHERLYRYLAFETIGPIRSYPGAEGKPALLMRLDIKRAIERSHLFPGPAHYFLKSPTPSHVLKQHYLWEPEALRELLLEKESMWKNLSENQRTYFLSLCPQLGEALQKKGRSILEDDLGRRILFRAKLSSLPFAQVTTELLQNGRRP
ncbi:MAG: PilZ domain-containing protein [Candidatus Omnitrophica bacterium]|nr:PilZ domain-containing protein [Candidatus Omnitrophota bacterium]